VNDGAKHARLGGAMSRNHSTNGFSVTYKRKG